MSLSRLEIILVEPIYPGNVGAIAHSAANFGVETVEIIGDIRFYAMTQNKCLYMAIHYYKKPHDGNLCPKRSPIAILSSAPCNRNDTTEACRYPPGLWRKNTIHS